ncbi:NACHT domain- and WD repeat-containing protein 1-like [Saccoglossus kowalevskii]|uniref:NACHT and WD repeat domain-containing protein 1-like n=1 Tax=Saccoglossus kowalevskii TaxID=10224 RepID=A0ABM0M4G8_SACKO|nr:PREDICTED: NACHT and WD repeat domain-containing protein 1-like [Saccoglossus kowalevskii]
MASKSDSTMDDIYAGHVAALPQLPSRVVKVFLSCLQSDTESERVALLQDVYPDLQEHCLQYGLDFQLFDMHQYGSNSITIDHETTATRILELEDSHRLSQGPFFVSLIGSKYGECILPAVIEEAEYAHIKDCAFEAGRNINLLDEWYLEDVTSTEKKVYRLQPISMKLKHFYDIGVENKELQEKDRLQWKKTHETLLELLQQCSEYAFDEGLINEDEVHKYYMSGLETEVSTAISRSEESAKNCLFVFRNLEDIPQNLNSDHPELPKYIDMKKPKHKFDKKAQDRLKKLKEGRIPSKVPGENILNFSVKWTEKGIDPEFSAHKMYLKDLCMQVSEKLKTLIDRRMASECQDPLRPTIEDSRHMFNEVVEHVRMSSVYCRDFVGRETLLSQVKNSILSNRNDSDRVSHPIVLEGIVGSGKSATLSMLAKTATSWLGENTVAIIRFTCLTLYSKSARDILISICRQICKAYKKKLSDIPEDFDTLKSFFPDLLNKVSNASRPLLIIIDNIENVRKDFDAHNLQWLPANLPTNVFVIVSITHDSQLKVTLEKKILISSNFIQVPPLTEKELQRIINQFLHACNRTLTTEQLKLFVRAVQKNCQPLFAKLLCQETKFVNPSGNGREPITACKEAIHRIFQHLEEKYGSIIVQHTIRYLTAPNHGITEIEILDLLSCNDEVINAIYPNQLPMVLRFPHRVWANIKYDLGLLLCEVHIDNKTLLKWSNEILKQTAKDRYLCTKTNIVICHRDFSELFLQTWVKQKPLNLPNREVEVDDNRKVAPQPLLYGETRYNMRRLSELWYHLIFSGDLKRLKMATFCNFEYLLAKTHATSIYHLISDFDIMFQQTIDSELELISNAIRLSLAALSADPLQLAAELIGRLLPMKDDYPEDLENLVQQAMEWCDLYTRPLLVPLSSWLPNPRESLVTSLSCEGLTWMTVTLDNQNVICATRSNAVTVYHIASKQRIRNYHGHESDITCLQLSHDEKFIATGSTDKTVRMWDLETEKSLLTLTGHMGSVTCLTISHNDHRVMSGSSDCMLNVYRVDTGEKLHTFKEHSKPITSIAINSYDDVLVSTAADTTIKIWNLDDFTLLESIEDFSSSMICMALSDDNTFIVSGCENGKVQLNSLTTGTEIHCLERHKHKVSAITVSHDSTYAIVGTTDNMVHVYNLKSAELLHTFTGHTHPITCLSVTQDDYFVISASFDQTVKVWNLDKQPRNEPNPDNHKDQVLCVAISKDGTYAITGSKDCTLKIWNLEISQIVQSLEEHEKPVTSVDLAEDCTFAVSGSEDATVKVWSVMMGFVVVTFSEHRDKITTVRILSDNQRILSADMKNSIKVWFAESGEVILSCSGPSTFVTTTPSSTFCISGDGDERMKIWQVGDGKSVHTISHLKPITCFTVTKDNKFCITGSEDESLKVWEIETGKITQILAGHDDGVTCVAVADHNRHVISGSLDTTLIIWNMMTGEVDRALNGHTDGVTGVRMTTDGSIAISGSKDGTLRVWSVQRGTLITSFYMHVGVVNLEMSFDASHIIVQLADGGHAPLLCLHNSPATDVKSQSQVDINVNEDPWPVLPIKPKPPLVHKQSVVLPPTGSRKSTVIPPGEAGKANATATTGQTSNKKGALSGTIGTSKDSKGTPKKNKKSGVCIIL